MYTIKKIARVILFSTLLFVNFSALLFAQNASLAAANRKTAVRFLKLAEDYLTQRIWSSALAQAQMGLAYDDTVADLWYIQAASLINLGKSRAEVLPLVAKALTEGEWVDYNRDGARILYADLLCDTGSYEQALGVLDALPFIYSADAEYIRIKSYYRMKTDDAVEKARSKVNSARKIYPKDMRFPRLFFRYEYAMKSDSTPVLVQSIANSFIAKMPEYDNPDAELEIYAALFAEGEAQKRMLQAFAAHNMEHPLYAAAAVSAGLLAQQRALKYFFDFADKSIPLWMLLEFAHVVTEQDVKNDFAARLTAYDGTLTIDTNGDLEPNLIVAYSRGRPASITWDANNDNVYEWSATCDFGVPVSLDVMSGGIAVHYGTYPAIATATFKGRDDNVGDVTFHLVDETYMWTPFAIIAQEQLKNHLHVDFFVPVVNTDIAPIASDALFAAASSYEVPSSERDGGMITFTVLDGKVQTADYYSYDALYAHAVFENGLPSMRSIDNDGDGIFETVEVFGYDPENVLRNAYADAAQIAANLFGLPADTGIYVKMIQIDSDADTVIDFVEEYFADSGKRTTWDIDGDGLWDMQHVRHPQKAGEHLIEDSSFYLLPERTLVTVTSIDNTPSKVVSNGVEREVYSGKKSGVYWIGKNGSEEDETRALEALANTVQGISVLVESGRRQLLAVRVSNNCYVSIMSEQETAELEEEAPLEAERVDTHIE